MLGFGFVLLLQAAAFIHRYLSLDERALREILPDNSEGL